MVTRVIDFVVIIMLLWIFHLFKMVVDSQGSAAGQTCDMLPVALASFYFTHFLIGRRDD